MDIKGLNEASQKIHKASKQKGFYDTPREIGTLLMLVVSELSEALEADRKGRHVKLYDFEKEIYKLSNERKSVSELFELIIKDSFEDEIADAIIRLLDLCGYLNIDIENHIGLKLSYNENRPHKHGKNY